jgi:16S rRNA (guanine(966)-N(2))-methyltransferase RsmD
VKEALFNILGGLVPGCRFLDLFAGTGNIGIEALSRGAGGAVFVEINKKNANVIKKNLAVTGFEFCGRVICLSVEEALSLLEKEGLKFNLIFLDPPYLAGLDIVALAGIGGHGIAEPGGKIIVESSKKDHLPPYSIGGLKIYRREVYGDTLLTFYQS